MSDDNASMIFPRGVFFFFFFCGEGWVGWVVGGGGGGGVSDDNASMIFPRGVFFFFFFLGGGVGGGEGGDNLGVIVVRVCEPVFQKNLPHSYTWPLKKRTHSYTMYLIIQNTYSYIAL